MLGARRLLAIPALVASIALVPAASAQSPSPQPECSLLTVEEVASAFAVSSVRLESWSVPFDCSFGGDVDLMASVLPRNDLESTKTDSSDGVDLTVGGLPAWFSMEDTSIWVDAGEQLLWLDAYASTVEGMTEDAFQAALITLAELALPRLPAGPSEDDIARLEAVIPDALGDDAVTVQVMSGNVIMGSMSPDDPSSKALTDILAAQGKTPADLVLAVGVRETEGDAVVLVGLFKGADASSLLLPFVYVATPDASTAEVTTANVGGKQVTVVATDPAIHAYATGDLAILYRGPDEHKEEFFAQLP